MRILLVSTLKRKVTEETTASRSRILYQLGKGLAARGHTVGLIGTKDSYIPGVTIYSVVDKGFIDLPPAENEFYLTTSYLVALEKKIEELAEQYDIVHNHTYPEFLNLYASERMETPMLTTLHAQATPEYDRVLSLFPNAHLAALSQAHKNLFTKARIEWVVHNGIDTNLYTYEEQKDDYLLWIGRLGSARNEQGKFIDAKGVTWAIQLAQQTGDRLLLSGNVEDKDFFMQEVSPHLNDKIQWVGDVSPEQPLSKEEVVKLMQKAKAFLMTINWAEPFGLVMAEAMACGTPVIGFDRGSVAELVVDGKTGFVVAPERGVAGLAEAVNKIGEIDRKACRSHVEQNFSLEKMVDRYETVYKQLQAT